MQEADKYTLTEIEQILRKGVADLNEKERDLDQFSSETGQTEWNLTAHLAPEIAKHFRGYSYDVDVAKVNLENRRPDIIIHKRGAETRYNLLAIEVKRARATGEVQADALKIREYWFDDRLGYRFGATINLWPDHSADIDVIQNKRIMPSLPD